MVMIYVKTSTGAGATFYVEDLAEMTVLQLKKEIFAKEGIPVESQRLVFASQQLSDTDKLSDCNIQEGSTVYIAVHLKGGSRRANLALHCGPPKGWDE